MTLNQKTISVKGKILRNFFVGLILTSFLSAQAQSSVRIQSSDETKSTTPKEIAVGLNVGVTNGIGIDVAYRFAKHWAARLGYNYADYSKENYTYTIVSTNPDGTKNNQNFSFDAHIKLSNVALNFEYLPWAKGRFKLLGGLSYFPKNYISAGGELLNTIKFNDVQLNSEDLGNGIVTVGFSQKISPFLGMGFGRTFPRKRINVSLDMGAYYKGDYKVNIAVNPGVILKENENNAAIIERNLNQKWNQKIWPVLNFRIAYRIQ